jgi:predicted solute-binding protein
MWMTRGKSSPVDFAAARDEGLRRIDEIVSNYVTDIRIGEDALRNYLSQNISYAVDDDLRRGMQLFFELAKKNRLCENLRELEYSL